jgi:hypothetical protein
VELMDEQDGSMEKLVAKLDPADVKTLFDLMRISKGAEVSTHPQPVKLDLPSLDLKLDGPTTYLELVAKNFLPSSAQLTNERTTKD